MIFCIWYSELSKQEKRKGRRFFILTKYQKSFMYFKTFLKYNLLVLLFSGNNELKDKIVMCYASIGHVLGIDCDKLVFIFVLKKSYNWFNKENSIEKKMKQYYLYSSSQFYIHTIFVNFLKVFSMDLLQDSNCTKRPAKSLFSSNYCWGKSFLLYFFNNFMLKLF